MQQDSTDKILQRMESQQLPDLSQMDKHWEDMRGMLVAIPIAKPLVSATAKWMIAATLVVAIAFFGLKKGWFTSGNKNVPVQEVTKTPKQQQPIPQQPDSVTHFNIQSTANPSVNLSAINVVTTPVPYTRISPDTPNKKPAPIINNEQVMPVTLTAKQTEVMNAQLMQQFWSQVQKKPQQFVIDNRYDSQIEGTEGTAIKIPANAFPNPGGGEITIELTEFYKYGEMIANKLTTSSYQRQLISDGMLRIRAIQNGAEVKMTGLKAMDVYMPRRDKSEDMQLFAGDVKEFIGGTSVLNWIPQGQRQRRFRGDGSGSRQLWPYVIRDKWFSKKQVVKYALGNRTNLPVKEVKKLIQDYYGDDIVVRVKKKERRYLGLVKIRSWHVDYLYDLPSQRNEFYARGYYGRLPDSMKAVLKTADSLENSYRFSVFSTGWINCDRFAEDPSPKIEFAVSGNKDEKVYCSYLVFKDIKSVLPGYASNNKCTFYNIPQGKDVTLVTIGIRNGKTVCSMKDMRTVKGDITGLHFDETNPEKFKQTLVAMRW